MNSSPQSIRKRILSHMGMTFALVIATAMLMVNIIMRHQIDVASREASKHAIAAASNIIENDISVLDVEVEQFSKDRGVRTIAFESGVDTKSIVASLSERKGSKFCDWYTLTDAEGKVRGSSSDLINAGLDLSSCLSVASAKSGTPKAAIEKVGSRFAIISAVPIRSGEFVVALAITGKWFDSKFVRMAADSLGSVIAFSSGDTLISCSNTAVVNLDSQQKIEGFELNGVPQIGSRFVLPSKFATPAIEGVVLLPAADIEKPFVYLARGLAVLLGTSLLILLAISSAFTFSIARRLRLLADAAEDLKAGRWPEQQVIEFHDEIGTLQATFDDMAESIREGNDRLIAMLQIDPLTGLPNHRTFRESVASVLAENDQTRNYALVIFDIDGFEKFNRIHGPDIADGVLKDVSRIVKRNLSPDNLYGRHGGNEFGIFVDASQVDVIANEIRGQVNSETIVTVSAGIAHVNAQTQRVDLLLLAGEIAVSQAKEAGRNRIRTFTTFDFDGDENEMHRFVNHSSYSAVKALAEAVDAKDEYTRGHSRRVADYAVALARELGYDEGFVNLVHVTGTLHDVGKIGVPDYILKKTERLTDDEFALIKRHPELGEKIVAQIPQLRDTLPGVRHHHERWDGRGYPDGLCGEEIPIIARILAVADSYDAMTSDRSYRKGLSHEVAVEQIIKGAGQQFDPGLVFKFVGVLNLEIQEAA